MLGRYEESIKDFEYALNCLGIKPNGKAIEQSPNNISIEYNLKKNRRADISDIFRNLAFVRSKAAQNLLNRSEILQ